MSVSIIIVSWNTREVLRACIESVFENSGGVSVQVIVVDNASSDGSAEMVREKFGDVKLIVNSENRGFAAANNQGILAADGKYILLLNSDTVVLDNAIKKTVDFAEVHSDAGVVGCKILNPDMSLQRSCFMFPSILNMLLSTTYLYKVFAKNKFFGRERMSWWEFDSVRQVDVVMGCFMLLRKDVIDKTGMMDERFFMYAEETDLCYRVKQAGFKTYFVPGAQIIHLGGQSSAKVRGQMIIQLRLSVLKFIKKHYSGLSYYAACVLVGMFFAVRVPYWYAVRIFDRSKKEQAGIRARAYWGGVRAIVGF